MTANELRVLKAAPLGLRILCSSSPELDYPFSVLPTHIVPCGPIVRAVRSIGDVTPDLFDEALESNLLLAGSCRLLTLEITYYGLLRISKLPIKPNYTSTKSAKDVYAEYVLALLEVVRRRGHRFKPSPLNVLSSAGVGLYGLTDTPPT